MPILKLKIVELETENYHIMVDGEFADGTCSTWIIDTGASKTVLDKNLSDYYSISESDHPDGLQSAGINEGMVDTQVGRMKSLKLGTVQIDNLKVALIDLSHVNDIYSKYSDLRIAGLIGGDILKKYHAVIDYRKKKMILQNQ